MDSAPLSCRFFNPVWGTPMSTQGLSHLPILRKCVSLPMPKAKARFDYVIHERKQPKYVRYPRRTKLPPDSGIYTYIKQGNEVKDINDVDMHDVRSDDSAARVATLGESEEECEGVLETCEHDDWEDDEIEAISSLFQGRIPQKPGNLNRERPLPLPLPHKTRPIGLPTIKRQIRTSLEAFPSRKWMSRQIYKDPVVLLNLARQIRSLPPEKDVSLVLNKWGRFLRKGSLSLTIRELGHAGLPQRALQTFCWAQKQTHLYPDDRILAATVEILARTHELKLPFDLEKFISLASADVLEAIARGFIQGGNLSLAWKLLSAARDGKRLLDSSIYTKLILELGKNPDKNDLVFVLLEDLCKRDTLNLSPQDCTTIMKVCIRLQKFEYVECLFDWFRKSGNQPSVVMYTAVIHSRYAAMRYREALALVWEMESLDYLLDLPAYRVVIKLFVALNDLPRAVRYFAKIKEAGFSPTYDLYRDMINVYLFSGRLAKCKEVCKEVELAGFKLDTQLRSQLSQLERSSR